jgi:hypothetical protein
VAGAADKLDGEAGAPPRSVVLASIKRNLVAIISLFVALTGLSYNTWRNETTEAHRNVRQGAFAMLEQVGQLQQLVDQRFYAGKKDDVNRITCWGKVALLRDTAPLVSKRTEAEAERLFAAWSENLDAMDEGDEEAERKVSRQIAALRTQLVGELKALR